MKQVIIVADCFLPEIKSVSYLVRDLAAAFVARGYSVVLLVGDQNLKEASSVEKSGRLLTIRVGTSGAKSSGFIVRAFKEFFLPFLMLRALRRHRSHLSPTLVVVYSPSIFLTPVARWLKRTFNAPVYLVLRDIFPDWAIEAGVIQVKPVQFMLRLIAKRQYATANRIGVQSLGDLNTFTHGKHARYGDKTEHLPNWRTGWPPSARAIGLRKSLGLEEKVIFLIGGSIGPAQSPENLVQLARVLQESSPRERGKPEGHFLMIGNGPLFGTIQESIQSAGLKNFTVLPAMDFGKYAEYLAMADIGALLLNNSITSDNIPGRFLDYLQMALPVFAILNSGNELIDYVKNERLGFAFTSSQMDEATVAASKLIADAELRKSLGTNGPRLLDRDFNPCVTVTKIEKLLLQ